MTALSFITSGGMANIGGDLPEPERSPIQAAARQFGQEVRRLALANGIPASALRVWAAASFIGAVDNKAVHFVFAESLGGTSLQFIDLRKFGVLPLSRLTEDVRRNIGDPVFSFSVPHDHISSVEKLQNALNACANEYIQGLLKKFSREASEV
jgi:hypothetical protein